MENKFSNWLMFGVLFIFLLTISTPLPLSAGEVKALYEVELPASETTGPQDQAKLIGQAFQEVLVRASGSEKILSQKPIVNVLNTADKYVTQFSYHQRSATERVIKVFFNETLLAELFNTAKLPLWKKNRPLTLAWLVMDREKNLQWVGKESESQLSLELEKILKRRGAPLVFPLFDLTDTSQVSEQDVLQEGIPIIQQASKRYNADVILLGHVSQQPTGWQGHWTLLNNHDNTKVTWDNTQAELNALLNDSAESLTEKLQSQAQGQEELKAVPKNTHSLTLIVSGVLGVEQYAEVLEYLRTLPDVIAVEVAQITPEQTIFNLETSETKETITKSIQSGNMLVENPTFEIENEYTIHFKMAGAV